ncbi:hypothetical protein E4633_12625 [Geomonas terrae]|uniref:Uncharacterized protein n=1 Tax=Geomonas terrae TaxID=2562681 RepID=A0A4S1CCQ3_9BACT|nr:hypothetical protein [Geomonas terrae]TGU71185.1 hypothetical protein E4633_12625 [Geomonas terrae]
MTPIIPELKLFTTNDSTSIHIDSLIIGYKGNHYHLPGGTNDTIHLFAESIALYALTINEAMGTMALNAFMVPEPDPINSIYLHSLKEIKGLLGSEWERLSVLDITQELINYLI